MRYASLFYCISILPNHPPQSPHTNDIIIISIMCISPLPLRSCVQHPQTLLNSPSIHLHSESSALNSLLYIKLKMCSHIFTLLKTTTHDRKSHRLERLLLLLFSYLSLSRSLSFYNLHGRTSST